MTMRLEIEVSRNDGPAAVELPPLALIVASGAGAAPYEALATRTGARSVVADLGGALEAARAAAPKVVLVDAADPFPVLRLVEQLRADDRTRSAGIAVQIEGGAAVAAALRKAGANVVYDRAVDAVTCERRVQELLRVPRRREIACRIWFASRAESGRWFAGRAVNISVHGMLIESRRPVAEGTILDVSLALPEEDDRLGMVGQVVRTDGLAAGGRRRHALKFLVLKGDAQERITALVEEEPYYGT
jgi:hypothetical protein